ncbi:response regulator [Paenibacillus algorifonticola]|uniref:response regulator transcription factor n=1 Tax=Paenibacillus algorifonticola TaxID=684063 RepID=UPI003D2A3409
MGFGNAMVVEDQRHFRRGLVRMIEESGHAWNVVGEAANGLDALKLAEQHKPDLVLTDIRMPAMDGIELVTHLRRRHPDTIVIVLTGFRSFDYAQAALKLGVLDYLVKPCTEEDVRLVLGKANERLQSRQLMERERQPAALANTLPLGEQASLSVMQPSASPSTSHEAKLAQLMQGKPESSIDKAIAYVGQHFAEACRMTEVAAHIHLNPSYFSVLFKKTTGESFTSFVTRVRMEQAMHLLKTTDLKILEISSATGFDEPNYFTNVFKQYYQMSPKECRRGH